jgi:hypothetical protein
VPYSGDEVWEVVKGTILQARGRVAVIMLE